MKLTIASLLVISVFAFSGCAAGAGDGYGGASSEDGPTVAEAEDADVGRFITDGAGLTLYVFTNDTKAQDGADPISACEGGCLDAWPVFHVSELRLAAGLDAGKFGEFTRPDGSLQSTWNGWPLYYHAPDTAPGQITGHGIGDSWFAAGTPLPGVSPEPNVVKVEHDELGAILTTGAGITLYVFTKDTFASDGEPAVSACEGGCLETWPAWYNADLVVGDGLDRNLFDTIERADGAYQTTWKGMPLYTHTPDSEPGAISGHGMGGVWYAAGAQP